MRAETKENTEGQTTTYIQKVLKKTKLENKTALEYKHEKIK